MNLVLLALIVIVAVIMSKTLFPPFCQETDQMQQGHSCTKSIMKKAGQKVNSQHESKEQTVVDVIEQLGNCRLDNQEKVTACELPLQNVNTQISSNSSLQEKLEASEISDIKYSSSKVTLVGISKKSAEHFKRKFAKSNQVSGSASSSLQVCPGNCKGKLT